MVYITSDDYLTLTGTTKAPDNFDVLEQIAGDWMDLATNFFYQANGALLEADDVERRRDSFKKAVAWQVKYMSDTGITSSEQYAKASAVTSQTIGKTTVIKGSGTSGTNRSGNLICDEALNCLAYTGLIFRGVWHL